MQSISLCTLKPIDNQQQAFKAILSIYRAMGYSQELTLAQFTNRGIPDWLFANVTHNGREIVIGISSFGKISLSRELSEPLRRTLDADWMTADCYIQAHLNSYLGKP